MPDLKFMSNKRLTIALALAAGNPFVNPAAPTVTEANAMKNVSAATRVNGYTFGMQPAGVNDDRSFADDPAAQTRGFHTFGGDMPFYLPTNYADTADLLQQVWTLVKTQGVELWAMTRLGKLNSIPFAAADIVNIYRVLSDGFNINIEGITGGIASITFLPKGDVYPNVVLAPAAPVTVSFTVPAAMQVGKATWAINAVYQGVNIGGEIGYIISDPTKLSYLGHGIFLPLAAGAVTVTGTYPGATNSTPTAVTVT